MTCHPLSVIATTRQDAVDVHLIAEVEVSQARAEDDS